MATYAAIAVVANTIRGLLRNSQPPDLFSGAEFKLFRAQDFQTASAQISFGISIYLHRVEFNTQRRVLPPRVTLDGRRFRPPTAVDLHFLITAWGRTAEEQMGILGWTIRTLQDTAELPAGLLNRFSGERPEQVFGDTEAVELVGEVLTPQDFVNIWGNALVNQQPSISYAVRQVLLDSEVEFPEGALVQSRTFDYAKVVSNGSTAATIH